MTIKEFIRNQSDYGNIYSTTIEETLDNLKSTTSLMLEFKDSTASYNYSDDSYIPSESTETVSDPNGVYTKYISPLFFDRVMHEDNNKEFLDVVTSFVPYYYLEPTDTIDESGEPMLQDTRDLGINDVPAPMQNSQFWSTWFRDTWGYVQNKIILNVFDKLQYPFITENQYMNSFLFSDMADSIFEGKPEVTEDEYIGFMNTQEENDSVYDSDYQYLGEEVGCLDYIDDVVNQKLLSNYAIIDYTDKQSVLLSKWCESIYKSGQLDTEELDREKTIFKLQDIKNELLRRKFAGSRTLYSLAINSIDRQGSFITTVKAYDLPYEARKPESTFNNKRNIRIIRIPGLISKYFDFNDLTVNLVDTYYDSIPLNILIPLFYTSAPQSLTGTTDTTPFRTEQFLTNYYTNPKNIKYYSRISNLGVNALRNAYIRDNSNVINWNSLQGIITSNNINEGYETLDKIETNEETGTQYRKVIDPITGLPKIDPITGDYVYELNYRTLDSDFEFTDDDGLKTIEPLRLDIKHDVVNLKLVSGGVADINADKVLYHKSSLQSSMTNYPYVTYPISGGNSLSLMDTYWLNYIEREASEKSKVQDNTKIGTQLNTIHDLGYYNNTITTNFFGISYTNDTDEDYSSIESDLFQLEEWNNQRYALLWYCTITYNVDTFEIQENPDTHRFIDRKLISKITLRIDDPKNEISDDLKDYINGEYVVRDEHKKYTQYNIGVLPMTFPSAVNDILWTNSVGFYHPVSGQYTKVKNDLDKKGYSEAYFVFSESDVLKDSDIIKGSLLDSDSNPLTEYTYPLRMKPSSSTKAVYYVIKRDESYESQLFDDNKWVYDDLGRAVINTEDKENFYWSDAIPVINLTDSLNNSFKTYYPDWYRLNYFLNPYLNFTKECASPLNKNKVEPSLAYNNLTIQDESLLTGPSKFAALSNLTRMRSLSFACNDNGGGLPMEWTTDKSSTTAKSIYGSYLKRYKPDFVSREDVNAEYSSIYGDNRVVDPFDSGFKRSLIYQDELPLSGEPDTLYILEFTEVDPQTGEIPDTQYYYWNSKKEVFEDISILSLKSTRTNVYNDENSGMKGIRLTPNFNIDSDTKWYKNYLRLVPVDNLYLYLNYTLLSDLPKTKSTSVKDCYYKVSDTSDPTYIELDPQPSVNDSVYGYYYYSNKWVKCTKKETYDSTKVYYRQLDTFTWVKCASDDVYESGKTYAYMYSKVNPQPEEGTAVTGYYYRNEDKDEWVICTIKDTAKPEITYYEEGFKLVDTSKYDTIYQDYPTYTNKIYDSNNNVFDWDKWYWNTDINGKTMCFNLQLESASLYTTTTVSDSQVTYTPKDTLIIKDNAFELRINACSSEAVSDTSNLKYKLVLKAGDKQLESESLSIDKFIKNSTLGGKYSKNIRVSASLYPTKGKYALYLCMDDLSYKADEDEELATISDDDMKSKGIDLFCQFKQDDVNGKINTEGDGHKYIQSDCFYGSVYDVRLYNVGKSLSELQILNMGSFREMFSYAPSTYKLAYTIYKDIAFLKTVHEKGLAAQLDDFKITAVRSFNRSIWDSIMIDPHPVMKEEKIVGSLYETPNYYNPLTDTDVYKQSTTQSNVYWLNDCIEQELLDKYEVYNGINPLDNDNNQQVYIKYNKQDGDIVLNSNDLVTIVDTMLEPVDYNEDVIDSTGTLGFERNTSISNIFSIQQKIDYSTDIILYDYIKIPYQKDSSDDYFKYIADISPNFIITPESDLSRWLSRGDNISLEYNSLLNKPVTRLTDITKYSSATNNILIPLMVPKQDEDYSTGDAYLDRFYVSDVVLNNSLTYFLNAGSYYNEIQIPVAVQYEVDEYNKVSKTQYTITQDTYPKYKQESTVESKIYYYNIDKDNPDTFQIIGFDSSTTYYNKVTRYNSKYTYDESKVLYVKINNKWEVLEDEFFRDDYTYRQDTTEFIFDGSVPVYTIVDGNYTMCIRGALSIYLDYYTLDESDSCYSPTSDTHPKENVDYYYKDSTTQEFKMFMGNKLSEYVVTEETTSKVYYEDILTENKYYYEYEEGKYKLTNLGYPLIKTFKEWKSQVNKDLYTLNRTLSSKYYNKWDALRVLKEGTYYFTCKYPMQIIPFADDSIDSSTTTNFTTYYASCRFKIVVSGVTKEFDTSDTQYDIEGYPSEYWAKNIDNTLKSPSHRLYPDDNRTFPHRQMNIDLYSMDVTSINGQSGIAGLMITNDDNSESEDYTFNWKLIATNHPTEDLESRDIVLLDKESIEDGLAINQQIALFLEKSYLSSFFIAKSEKGSETENPESADDDLIDPIKLELDINNYSNEKIVSNTEDDMDNQVLIAGKSYKILFDYTAKVTEISFIDETIFDTIDQYDRSKTYDVDDYCEYNGVRYQCINKIHEAEEWNGSNWTPSWILVDDEKVNYSRLSNLLDTNQNIKSDYSYVSDGQSFIKTGTDITNYNSGFDIDSNGNWKDSGTYSNKDFYLGNPYSRSSNQNYLLKLKNNDVKTNSRQNINNSYTFPYTVKNGPSTQVIPSVLSTLGVITSYNGDYRDRDDFDEASILKAHFDSMQESVISNLNSNACGLFTGLSTIYPNYTMGYKEGLYNQDTSVVCNLSEDSQFDLFGYFASTRSISVKNSLISLTRTSLYSNNLLANNSFDNQSYWVIDKQGEWVSDDNWGQGKDVYQFTDVASVNIKYLTGSLSVTSLYEAAINIKSESVIVKAIFYKNNNIVSTVNLTKSSKPVHTGWYTYSGETSESITADSISYVITSDSTLTFSITKAVVRKCSSTTHSLGLYDSLNDITSETTSSKVDILSHNMVLLKDKETNEYLPIQFNNEVLSTVSASGKVVNRPKSGQFKVSSFIAKYSLDDYTSNSRLSKLLPPWVRRMHCLQEQDANDNKVVTTIMHSYKVDKNDLGIRTKKESYLPNNDIFDTSNTTISAERGSGDNSDYMLMRIESMPVKVNSNNELTSYNINLRVNESDPITISEERFSVLFNCFDPARYRSGQNYSVGVTNIQLLRDSENAASSAHSYEKREIVYELEFLPIIYSELRNHLSLNILLYKRQTTSSASS